MVSESNFYKQNSFYLTNSNIIISTIVQLYIM